MVIPSRLSFFLAFVDFLSELADDGDVCTFNGVLLTLGAVLVIFLVWVCSESACVSGSALFLEPPSSLLLVQVP